MAGKKMWLLIFSMAFVLSWSLSAQTNNPLPSIFSDNMVLQRSKAVPVWGQGNPGDTVTVNFNGQNKHTSIDKNGKWQVKLDAMYASNKPMDMTIKVGNASQTIKNILIGEVWVCSGQSNMEWAMAWGAVDNKKQEMAEANYPQIRFIDAPHVVSGVPRTNNGAQWKVCSPKTVGKFSAVGYFFGRNLLKQLDVPIGLIGANWGGTAIEPWTPTSGFKAIPTFERTVQTISWKNDHYKRDLKASLPAIKAWIKRVEKDENLINSNIPDFPIHKLASDMWLQPTALYNGMLAPFVPYAIRGAIWYQGEANLGNGMKYGDKMKALITGWRKEWKQGDFPFYFCQIAPFKYGGADKEQLCELWQGQYIARDEIKNCEMASTVDIGNVNNIHPTNKQDVGKRLALIALANTYKKDNINWENPVFAKQKIDGNKILLTFKNCADGLKSKDSKTIREFRIAGKDGKFLPAKAEINNDKVTISSDKVASPIMVKYAWRNGANPNLVNNAGLPVLPFKTIHNIYEGKHNHAQGKPYTSSDPNRWGWHGGLTDGSFKSGQKTCFATSSTAKLPKNVVIDLLKPQEIATIVIGTPCFGSTKTVDISISSDNKNFSKVGQTTFTQGKEEKKNITLPTPTNARYVKLTYLDKYQKRITFDPNFMFTTEVMVFSE